MTDIVFDNIIFSLQKAGGISGVWRELLEHTIHDERYHCQFLEYANAQGNLFRKGLQIKDDDILNRQQAERFLERYRNPSSTKTKEFIFHSSYYRISTNKQAKNVTTVHDFVYEFYRTGLPKFVHHQQKKQAILASEAIICVSENTKKDLLDFFPQIPQERLFVIHNGVSETFRPLDLVSVPESLEAYGTFVLYVGLRAAPHKNFQSLIRSLETTPGLNLILIGGGTLTEAEVRHLDQSIPGRYHQMDNVSNEQLNLLYNTAFALVYPSTYEGFGIPILEAQRAGCPVIATNRSSISEVAGDGALLTESGADSEISQCLEKLLDTPLRNQLVEKGFVNSNQFTWSRMAKETQQVYDTLLSD